jgi:transcriptional regulator with PAS, ATPase and Fis domain
LSSSRLTIDPNSFAHVLPFTVKTICFFAMTNLPQLIGTSAATRAVEEEINSAARTDAKVLITGESGVGKEVVAQLIHHRSARHRLPLVTINCAGIPDTLLASELFGHVRGSFTDAFRDKRGWLEEADGGTVFLDEIGEMSAQMQSLLLRFLENGEIQRVGSDRQTTRVDVRVITATNQPLLDRVAAQEFREDLFYRLNVIHVEIPPLRERRDDIPILFEYFLGQFAARDGRVVPPLTDEASQQLKAFDWPGNVRQLRNIVERLALRSIGRPITKSDLPREILSMGSAAIRSDQRAASRSPAELMFERMVRHGEDFWTVVHRPFMARDVTRDDVRAVVREGLEMSRGSYKAVVPLFNMPPGDYKRLLNFLRKFECHLPLDGFRALQARLPNPDPAALRQPAANE